jgi:hypothetical protein
MCVRWAVAWIRANRLWDDYKQIDLGATTHGQIETAKFSFINPTEENLKPDFLRTRDIAADLAGTTPAVVLNNLHKRGV